MSAPVSTDQLSWKLHRRLKKLQSRVRIHRWELRQREYAKGSWHRLRRVLSGAAAVYAIPAEAAARMEADGREPLAVGFELEPPLRMYWLDESAVGAIRGSTPLAVRLDTELLRAANLALVPF